MLATPVAAPFDRAGWYFEIKWDGFRAVAEVAQHNVKLYSRTEHPFETEFAELVQPLRKLGHDIVLDGEIVVLDQHGKSHFELLQTYRKHGIGTLAYYVFDLLYLDGTDLRAEPLRRRKRLLKPLLKGLSEVRFSEHIEERGMDFYQSAIAAGLEGVMAKDACSPYREGMRGLDWLKLKPSHRQEAVICGFTRPRGSRQGLGALVLGLFEREQWTYCGHVGSGLSELELADLRRRLNRLVQKDCPFSSVPKTNMPATWVKPALVAEIAFQQWTRDGRMRHPRFLGLREDKSAFSVRRESAVVSPKREREFSPAPSHARRAHE